MLQAAKKKAESMNVKFSFCIIDTRGDVIVSARMDGARYYTVDIAKGKVLVSASFGPPSAAMAERAAQPGPPMQGLNQVGFQGKVMFVQGQCP